MVKATFRIGPTPDEAERADYLPYVLTPSERTQAAWAKAYLEDEVRKQNNEDNARALAGVLWVELQS